MMKSILCAAALSLLASPAFAQWERFDSTAHGTGTGDVQVTFTCGEVTDPDPKLAGLFYVMAPVEVYSSRKVYEVVLLVDGVEFTRHVKYLDAGESGAIFQDVSYLAKVSGDYSLYDLAEAIRRGSTLTVMSPALGINSTISLKGSSRALAGIYSECGMRPTGTGVMN